MYRWLAAKDVFVPCMSTNVIEAEDLHTQATNSIHQTLNKVGKMLMTSWASAAFLCDPYHVMRYNDEMNKFGILDLDAAFDPNDRLPQSLEDQTCYRVCMHYALTAVQRLIGNNFYKGDSPECVEHRRQTRRELDDYVGMRGNFCTRCSSDILD